MRWGTVSSVETDKTPYISGFSSACFFTAQPLTDIKIQQLYHGVSLSLPLVSCSKRVFACLSCSAFSSLVWAAFLEQVLPCPMSMDMILWREEGGIGAGKSLVFYDNHKDFWLHCQQVHPAYIVFLGWWHLGDSGKFYIAFFTGTNINDSVFTKSNVINSITGSSLHQYLCHVYPNILQWLWKVIYILV